VFYGQRLTWLGYLIAIGSGMTVFTTSMIYAQLKTVPSWNTNLTPVCYFLFSIACGALVTAGFGYWESILGLNTSFFALVLVMLAWGAKFMWWQAAAGDTLAARGSTAGSATGLGSVGDVKLFEKPHSGENYLTREMVHQVGRKHAQKLRKIALVLGLVIPAIVCCMVWLTALPAMVLFLGFVSLVAGLFVERWLFFAEAKHAVSLYY